MARVKSPTQNYKTVPVTYVLPPDVIRALKIIAMHKNTVSSHVISQVISEYIAAYVVEHPEINVLLNQPIK